MTLKPIKETRTYRRNLPHIEIPGSVYFVTFRTQKQVILSDAAKDVVFESLMFHDGEKYKLYACVVMETHAHVIFQPLVAQPNGTGVPPVNGSTGILPVNTPVVAFYTLSQIMHSIKSYSAKIIKEINGGEGNIWLDENYDRIVRDEAELVEKLSYICNNPVKAGLVERPEDYKWLYLNDAQAGCLSHQ